MQITAKRLRFLKPRDKAVRGGGMVALLSRTLFDFDRAICAPTCSDHLPQSMKDISRLMTTSGNTIIIIHNVIDNSCEIFAYFFASLFFLIFHISSHLF